MSAATPGTPFDGHTPGPWLASEADYFGDHNIQSKMGVETDTDHLAIAAVVSNLRPAGEVAANARLIAAAPDLLALVKKMVAQSEALIAVITESGAADDFVAQFCPDARKRNGQPLAASAKSARRAINEARATLTEATAIMGEVK